MSCYLTVNNVTLHFCKCLTAPLKCTGEISARYMGARPAFNPELIPMKNRPMMIISKDPAAFEAPAEQQHDLRDLSMSKH